MLINTDSFVYRLLNKKMLCYNYAILIKEVHNKMKRPLAVSGFTALFFAFVLCIFSDSSFAILSALVSYAAFMVSAVVPKLRKGYYLPTVMLCCLLVSVLFYGVQSDYEKLSSLAVSEADVVCRVEEEPVFNEEYGRYYCKAKVITINGSKYNGNIRLSFGTYDNMCPKQLIIGDKLSFISQLYKVGGYSKEIADYFRSENIYIGAYGIKNLSITENELRPLGYYGNELRKFISEKFRENFSRDTAGFLTALLTGDKTYVSDEIYDSFKNSGTAHLMAVSGMHLSVLTLFFALFLERLRDRHKYLHFAVMCTFIFFIMFLASFSSSVVRAGVMLTLLFTGQLYEKYADSLNSLGFACLIIIISNPFSVLSVGFLLSVFSTLAIIVSAVPFCNRHRYFISDRLGLSGKISFNITRAVMLSIVISLCVMVYTMPVMAISFGRISLVSPLANLLLLPVTTLIITLSFISAILCCLGIMPSLLTLIVEKISAYCIGVSDLLGGTDRFVLKVDTLFETALCCAFPFVLYLAIKSIRYIRKKISKRKKPL